MTTRSEVTYGRPPRQVEISLLGATGSGKSTFLLSAHAVSSAAADFPRLASATSQQRAQLRSGWLTLAERSEYPPSTDRPRSLRSKFQTSAGSKGVSLLIHDHRGGVLDDQTSQNQAEELQTGLNSSDAVFVMVDGEVLTAGYDRMHTDPDPSQPAANARLAAALRLGMVSGLVMKIAAERGRHGLAPPLLALVLTKADAIGSSHPLSRPPELARLLGVLFPLAFDSAMTTLVCAVGNLRDRAGRCSPIGSLVPFAMVALRHLATERRQISMAVQESLAFLRSGARRPPSQQGRAMSISEVEGDVLSMQARLIQLQSDLDVLAAILSDSFIVRSGVRVTNREVVDRP